MSIIEEYFKTTFVYKLNSLLLRDWSSILRRCGFSETEIKKIGQYVAEEIVHALLAIYEKHGDRGLKRFREVIEDMGHVRSRDLIDSSPAATLFYSKEASVSYGEPSTKRSKREPLWLNETARGYELPEPPVKNDNMIKSNPKHKIIMCQNCDGMGNTDFKENNAVTRIAMDKEGGKLIQECGICGPYGNGRLLICPTCWAVTKLGEDPSFSGSIRCGTCQSRY
jgi:hypothetical protein